MTQKDLTELIQNRRYLHACPEIGLHLPKTKAFVIKKLTEYGLTPTECGRSITAFIGKKRGKILLLRADMDGLKIKEQTGKSFSAKNGNMHACGHDMHTAILLAVAKMLKEKEASLNGGVKFLFQVAEETLQGAKDAVDAGVLQSPKISGAMMLHVLTGVDLPSNKLIVAKSGITAPSADFFKITVFGKSCHGSTPQNGIDAIAVACRVILALEEIVAKEFSFQSGLVLTVGNIQGGTADNVIADKVIFQGTMRTFDEEVRKNVKLRIKEIVSRITKAFRAKGKLVFTSGCPCLKNDEALSRFAYETLSKKLGQQEVYHSADLEGASKKMGGSEDFAYISQEVPALMLSLTAGSPADGYVYPLHHSKTDFDEKVMQRGAQAFYILATEWLK